MSEQTTAGSEMQAIVSTGKITLKNIGLTEQVMKKLAKEDGFTSRDAATIGGDIHYMETGSTTFGDYNKFHGTFLGRNDLNGDVFQGSELIMPGTTGDKLAELVAKNGSCRFTMTIRVSTASNAHGYKWQGVSYLDASYRHQLIGAILGQRAIKIVPENELPAPKEVKQIVAPELQVATAIVKDAVSLPSVKTEKGKKAA